SASVLIGVNFAPPDRHDVGRAEALDDASLRLLRRHAALLLARRALQQMVLDLAENPLPEGRRDAELPAERRQVPFNGVCHALPPPPVPAPSPAPPSERSPRLARIPANPAGAVPGQSDLAR